MIYCIIRLILAHHKDNRRIDLVIKGGRHMYLRANSQSERQKWLVALGSTKQQELTLEASKSLLINNNYCLVCLTY